MPILAMTFDLGSDEDVAFERRQLLEAHAASYGFEVVDSVEAVFGPGQVICVDKSGSNIKVREFMNITQVNRLTPTRVSSITPVSV